MQTRHRSTLFLVAIATLAAGLLSGCSGSFAPGPVQDEQVPIGNITGMVHGGQAPVTGASVYLYQASTSGYGTNATSLICNSTLMTGTCPSNAFEDSNTNYYVKTDASGNFALSGDYVCTVGKQVYMVAVGGNPGVGPFSTTATFAINSLTITVTSATSIAIGQTVTGAGIGAGAAVTAVSGTTITLSTKTTAAGAGVNVTFSNVNNTAIVQMAGLGQCPAAGNLAAQVPYLVINEVTTVAFAYSVSGFATTAYNVSTDATGTTALANAFANETNIVNLQWGQAPTSPNANPGPTASPNTNPQSKIYTLANLLATCVNSSSASSGNCVNLFKYATTSSGAIATDEANAIFNIAHNQAENVTNLYGLTSANNPFNPSLTAQPTDWTLPIVYNNVISLYGTNGGATIDSGPFNMVADASGNMWIGDEVKGAVKVTPLGVFASYDKDDTGATFGEIKGVAVTSTGSIWASDAANNKMTILDSTGAATFTSTAGSSGINGPAGIAFDSSGDAFVANDTAGTVSIFNPDGSEQRTTSHAFSTTLTGPAWIAVDSLGDAFAPSQTSTELGGLGTGVNKGKSVAIADAYALAIDSSNNLWMPNNSNGGPWTIYKISCPQTKNSGGTVTGVTCATQTTVSNLGAMSIPDRITLDGAGTLWIANQGATTVSAYNIAGITYVSTTNSWLASRGFQTGSTGDCLDATPDISGNIWTANKDGSVTELLGLGAPTMAPYIPGNYQTKP